MLSCLINICSARNVLQKPSVIHADFEVAMLTVLKDIYPMTVIKCCRFHLGQAWWRKIQCLGLGNEYKDNIRDICQWLKLSFGLHFTDPKEVEDCFVDELMANAPQDDRCTRFAEHFVDNYISPNSRYPPVLWHEIPSHTKRTNNTADSLHAHFNEHSYTSHPSICIP